MALGAKYIFDLASTIDIAISLTKCDLGLV